METIDLTQVFALMEKAEESRLSEKKAHLREVSDFGKYGEEKLENLARLGIALDELIDALVTADQAEKLKQGQEAE